MQNKEIASPLVLNSLTSPRGNKYGKPKQVCLGLITRPFQQHLEFWQQTEVAALRKGKF